MQRATLQLGEGHYGSRVALCRLPLDRTTFVVAVSVKF